jgi:carbon-monoxide dehydrogenase medium subunit
VKSSSFEYYRANTVDDAVRALHDAGDGGKAIAGGQSLVALMNFRLARPELLVDLNQLGELDYVESTADGGLRIGAMTRQRTIERSPLVAAACPLIAEAMPFVAHAAIRNRGTIGGSIAHADAGSELCTLSLALDARLRARGPNGDREIAAGEFFDGPFTTVLDFDEVLTEITIPGTPAHTGHAFSEVSRRRGDFALAGVAAVIGLAEDGTIAHARLAYTSLGPTALRAPHAEEALLGNRPDPGTIDQAITLLSEDLAPTDDLHASGEFRLHLARVLTGRMVRRAVERAGV